MTEPLSKLPIASRFTAPDDHPGVADLVGYLDRVDATPFFRGLQAEAFELMRAPSGCDFLDLGCGLGRATREAAEVVGPQGRVVGLDISHALLVVARSRNPDLHPPVFVQGDASALDFPADAFDRVRAERLLQHVASPLAVSRETVRVLRPGGRAVFIEPDWSTLRLDHPDPAVSRAICAAIQTAIRNPSVGAGLTRLAAEAGMTVVADLTRTWRSSDFTEISTVLNLARVADIAVREGLFPPSAEALMHCLSEHRFAAALNLYVVCAVKSPDADLRTGRRGQRASGDGEQ